MGRPRKTLAEVSASRRKAAQARWRNGTRGAEYQRLRDSGMSVAGVAATCGVGANAVRMALRLRQRAGVTGATHASDAHDAQK